MIMIITSRQYDAIVDIVTDLQKENEELKAKIAKKDEALTYVNDKLFERNRQYFELKRMLDEKGICYVYDLDKDQVSLTFGNIDFPATSKLPDPIQDINQILGH